MNIGNNAEGDRISITYTTYRLRCQHNNNDFFVPGSGPALCSRNKSGRRVVPIAAAFPDKTPGITQGEDL